MTPDDAYSAMLKELLTQYQTLSDVIQSDSSIISEYGQKKLSLGTTQENIDYLESLYKTAYPELPEHKITFMDVPEELEDSFQPRRVSGAADRRCE